MTKYKILVFCDWCGDVHYAGVTLSLEGGPDEKTSIADHYAGKEVPEHIKMTKNTYTCPNTGKQYTQEDNHQVFMVPVPGEPLNP